MPDIISCNFYHFPRRVKPICLFKHHCAALHSRKTLRGFLRMLDINCFKLGNGVPTSPAPQHEGKVMHYPFQVYVEETSSQPVRSTDQNYPEKSHLNTITIKTLEKNSPNLPVICIYFLSCVSLFLFDLLLYLAFQMCFFMRTSFNRKNTQN